MLSLILFPKNPEMTLFLTTMSNFAQADIYQMVDSYGKYLDFVKT